MLWGWLKHRANDRCPSHKGHTRQCWGETWGACWSSSRLSQRNAPSAGKPSYKYYNPSYQIWLVSRVYCLLQDDFDLLFNDKSMAARGTLCQLKHAFDHKSLKKEVKKNFQHAADMMVVGYSFKKNMLLHFCTVLSGVEVLIIHNSLIIFSSVARPT